jgi:hypothetical protein
MRGDDRVGRWVEVGWPLALGLRITHRNFASIHRIGGSPGRRFNEIGLEKGLRITRSKFGERALAREVGTVTLAGIIGLVSAA